MSIGKRNEILKDATKIVKEKETAKAVSFSVRRDVLSKDCQYD